MVAGGVQDAREVERGTRENRAREAGFSIRGAGTGRNREKFGNMHNGARAESKRYGQLKVLHYLLKLQSIS